MHEYESRIGFSLCGADGCLSVTGLIDMFQDCSTFQSEDVGMGVERLRDEGLVWVINYWELNIIRKPRLCERVVVGTYPYEINSFFAYRNFYMKDLQGEYIAKANTMWILLGRDKQLPVRIPGYVRDAYSMEERLDMTYSDRKILIPEKAADVTKRVIIGQEHLDSNGHVNNGQYIKLALAAVNEIADTSQFSRLRVDYRKQAYEGDIVDVSVFRCDNSFVAALAGDDGEIYSALEIIY